MHPRRLGEGNSWFRDRIWKMVRKFQRSEASLHPKWVNKCGVGGRDGDVATPDEPRWSLGEARVHPNLQARVIHGLDVLLATHALIHPSPRGHMLAHTLALTIKTLANKSTWNLMSSYGVGWQTWLSTLGYVVMLPPTPFYTYIISNFYTSIWYYASFLLYTDINGLGVKEEINVI